MPAQFPTTGALKSQTDTVIAVAKSVGFASIIPVIVLFRMGGMSQYVYSIIGVIQLIVLY